MLPPIKPNTCLAENFRRAENRTRECFDIARAKLRNLPNLPSYKGISLFRGSKTAGYVIPSKSSLVYLNRDLLINNEDNFLKTIIPHEVAHVFADYLNDRRKVIQGAHGQTWKNVMQNIFHLKPIRCHNMDTDGLGRSTKKYKYICSCRKIEVGIRVHSKISCGHRYNCKKCKKELVFLSEV
jgi:predicted SprT family Zn-dependent metalloprotease